MTPLEYAVCFFVAFIAAAIHFVQNMRANKSTAAKGNFIWTEWTYVKDEKWSIVGSLLMNILALFIFADAIEKHAAILDWKFGVFAFVGYGGDSIAGKLFGFASKRLDAAIDDKTTKADQMNPNPEQPTPMVMPKKDA